MTKLYDQFGRLITAQTKQPDSRPLAVAQLYNQYRDYVADGLTPQRLAAILKEADGGNIRRQCELFEQISEKDLHIQGEMIKRENAVADIEYDIEPATDSQRDLDVAEFIENYFKNLDNFDDIKVSMQDSIGKGFSAFELNWDISSGQAIPEEFNFIEQKNFSFFDGKGYLSKIPKLITDTNFMGEEIPAWKLLFHRYGGKAGHSTRSGILRLCAWMYLFKNYAVKDWVIFCEVYGMPLRLGKYPAGASEADKSALIAAIQSLGSDAAGVISDATTIEFIQNTTGSTGTDLYEKLASFCNKECSKGILGQTLTADAGNVGSQALGTVHNEVRIDLAKADTRAIASTLRSQVIRPIVGFNFGWDTPCPGCKPIWNEADDLVAKSTWVKNLLDGGAGIPESFVYSEFKIPEAKKGEKIIRSVGAGLAPAQNNAAPGQNAQNSFGISGRPTIAKSIPPEKMAATASEDIEKLTDQAQTESQKLIETLPEAVKKIVMSAKNLQEIKDKLPTVLKQNHIADIGNMMQRAFAAAELAGRYSTSPTAKTPSPLSRGDRGGLLSSGDKGGL